MKKAAFCYSTKDRVGFTKQTLPRVRAESDNFDLFWIDGSQTEEGLKYAETKGGVTLLHDPELHQGITGGADVAILYSLSLMLERGYEYLGLIENDVLLQPGWFKRIFSLFETPGLNVGAVSARCFSDRILEPRNGFAIMANVGAGMILLKREAAEAVLDHYRCPSLQEYAFWPKYLLGMDCPMPHDVTDTSQRYQMTADWSFESSMMSRGMVALACTPSTAKCIDENHDIVQDKPTQGAGVARIRPEDAFNLPIGLFDYGSGIWCQQPHQIIRALPEAFRGNWKIVWSRHNGPFGMKAMDTDVELVIPVNTPQLNVLVDIAEEGTVAGFSEVGSETIPPGTPLKKGGSCLQYNFGFAGLAGKTMKLSFSKPGAVVMSCYFSLPQPWFREKDGLRYGHLKKFL